MTWIKICGITNLEDGLMAADAGADALGFVFWEKSPRRVTPEAVRDIARQLAAVEKIGVFVDENLIQMENVAERVGLTGIQFHVSRSRPRSDESATFTSRTAKYVALRVNDLTDSEGGFDSLGWSQGMEKLIRAVLLDTGTDAQPGGTGKTFDWEKATQTVSVLQQNFGVVVAGGLTPTNVSEAMRILRPWGVDVSSGVEARPGKKDPEKVRAFIAAVREAEKLA